MKPMTSNFPEKVNGWQVCMSIATFCCSLKQADFQLPPELGVEIHTLACYFGKKILLFGLSVTLMSCLNCKPRYR